MTDAPSLLPRAATQTERHIEAVIGPRIAGIDGLGVLDNALLAPPSLLPVLARLEDVPPVWPQTEEERRALVYRAPYWHALIGTAQGLREGARLAGATVVAIERPPAKTFLSGWSSEDRARWLAQQPQLLLRDGATRSVAESEHLRRAYLLKAFPTSSSALARSHTRAEIRWPDGRVEQLVTYGWRVSDREASATVDFTRRATAIGQIVGTPLHGTLTRADARERIWRVGTVSYRETTAALWLTERAVGLAPLLPTVDVLRERTDRPAAAFVGVTLGATYSAFSDAGSRTYRRMYLHDPAVAAQPKHAPAILGFTVLSSPPFTARVRVRMSYREHHGAVVRSGINLSATAGNAVERISPVLDAMEYFRAAHDQVLIDTKQRQPIRASRVYRAGSVRANELRAI